jgi:ATP-dependent DNA ligase
VVLGPDGLSRFEDLRRREAAHNAILYAFDLIEQDGEDVHNRSFLDRKAALARPVAQYRCRHPPQQARGRGWPYRVRARLSAWR